MDQSETKIVHHIACIYNAAYRVRLFARGGRVATQREERSKAIREMGFIVRKALVETDSFEPILTAVVVGLSKSDDPPF